MARLRTPDEWYLGDPREGCIRDDGRVLETDNKIGSASDGTEIRYKWNGAYLNIGEQSPLDYATTVFYVSGGTGSSCDVEPISDEEIDDITDGED